MTDHYDIWVDFNDIGEDSTVTTYADSAEHAHRWDAGIGQQVTAGDNEGNRCPATLVSIDGAEIVLRLDMGRFQPAPE